jgi:hypothetical protein
MGFVSGAIPGAVLGGLSGLTHGGPLGAALGVPIGALTTGGIGAGLSALKRSKVKSDLEQIRRINEQMRNKEASSNVLRVQDVLAKMGATASHHDVPPDAHPTGEGVPALPPEAAKQERMIDSLQAAINYTKRQAKAVPKERMGEVLDEPAQRKSTDPVLHQNLDHAESAGVKLSAVKSAAARALLRKVAQDGAAPDATPEQKEKAEKLKAAIEAKKENKLCECKGKGCEKCKSGSVEKQSGFRMPIGGGF